MSNLIINIYGCMFACCLIPIMDYFTGWNILMSIPLIDIDKNKST